MGLTKFVGMLQMFVGGHVLANEHNVEAEQDNDKQKEDEAERYDKSYVETFSKRFRQILIIQFVHLYNFSPETVFWKAYKCNQTHQEEDEVHVVPCANTGSEPDTVVVEPYNASITIVAVAWSARRSEYVTLKTVPHWL